MYRVTLTFMFPGTEDEAWDVSEALEGAARKREYREVNSWVEQVGDGRGVLGGTEANPGAMSNAETLTRQAGGQPGFGTEDGFGPSPLGDEDGNQG